MGRALQVLSPVVGLVGNLIPLGGVLYWGWDTFQLLMLYWMETTILAFWTMMRLSRLSGEECGTFTVNGEKKQATPFSLVGFFALHSGAFILAHLLFLWLIFSQEWLKTIHSAGEFFHGLFVANGIWIALLFMFIAPGVAFFLNPKPVPGRSATGEKVDPVGGIVAVLYMRIVIMQVAIIFGAWFSGFTGSMAPLLIVIGLKTLFDLGMASRAPVVTQKLQFSSGSGKNKTSIEI